MGQMGHQVTGQDTNGSSIKARSGTVCHVDTSLAGLKPYRHSSVLYHTGIFRRANMQALSSEHDFQLRMHQKSFVVPRPTWIWGQGLLGQGRRTKRKRKKVERREGWRELGRSSHTSTPFFDFMHGVDLLRM